MQYIYTYARPWISYLYIWISSSSLKWSCFIGHPWVQVDGVAPDKPLDSAVLSRMKQFSAMNKLKKMALRVSLHRKEKTCTKYLNKPSKLQEKA